MSDGTHCCSWMLATQNNDRVENGQVAEGDIVTATDFVTNSFSNRVVVVLLDFTVNVKGSQLIGKPIDVTPGGGDASNAQQRSNCMVNPPAPVRTNAAPQTLRPHQSGANRQYAQPKMEGVATNSISSSSSAMANANAVSATANSHHNNVGVFRNQGAVVQQREMHVPGTSNERITPLRALNMYQNRWVIKCRVMTKSEVRHWDKGPTNQGSLFSATLMDSDGVEIRATFFREAVEAFYDVVQEGKTYTFANGKVKLANKDYSGVDNEHEITFGGQAEIHEVVNDGSIKAVALQRTLVKDIADLAPNSTCDILGVATEVGDVQEFTSKAGKPLTKCEVTLVDESAATIRLTLWGDKARENSIALAPLQNPIVGVRNCRVSDYGGRTLGTGGASQVAINPGIPEAGPLKQWFEQGGAAHATQLSSFGPGGGGGAKAPMKSFTERHQISHIKDYQLGSNKKDVVDVKATIQHIVQEKMWYYAAPEEGNNRKVVQDSSGNWFCEKDSTYYSSKTNRYILRTILADHTGSVYATAFNEAADVIMRNKTADDLEELKDQNETEFADYVNSCMFQQFLVRLIIKEETYNENTRQKCTILHIAPIDWTNECKQMLDILEKEA